jgi:glycosyltransferase involved in cell wall biosynthesis
LLLQLRLQLLLLLFVGGDGPKRTLLQQMISSEGLEGRVQLTGAIPHERARDFLVSCGVLLVLPQL